MKPVQKKSPEPDDRGADLPDSSRKQLDDPVDEASEESFPASDAPAWPSRKKPRLDPQEKPCGKKPT